MGKAIKLSVIILVGPNSDKKLLDICLKSAKFSDEIVTINTEKIEGSFSEWRNEGFKKSKGDWVFYLDSDEEISDALRNEVLDIIDRDPSESFAIPRRNIIFGKEFKYSGQYPDYQKRLFKRSNLKKWVGRVHEEPVYAGSLSHLKSPIIHHKNLSVSEMIDKTNKWSEIEAELMFEAGHPKMNIFRFASAGFREFVLRFIKQKSFLDGKEGVIYGIYQIYSRLISYSKLWEKQLSTTRI